MVHDSHGLHHFHKRKRIHVKHEPYPHPKKWKRFIDKTIYAVGVFGPLMTIPQLTKIWIDKNAAGVSAISWGAYLITAIFWFIYGVAHKEKPIIVTYAIWIFLEIFIVIGAVLYG
ncbi:hypothetical protein KY339_02695 [Candidatus Woesearchaeota archaeon]|nr:hypothetical protein [Candidatus Woesearchaeota archaeon]